MLLGGFSFLRSEHQIVLGSPQGSVKADLDEFLAGVRHLLRMGFDLEGSVKLAGGFIFRVNGERVQLRLGSHSEDFSLRDVEQVFRSMAKDWSANMDEGASGEHRST